MVYYIIFPELVTAYLVSRYFPSLMNGMYSNSFPFMHSKGKQNNGLFQEVHILTPIICENVRLCCKGELKLWTELRVLIYS